MNAFYNLRPLRPCSNQIFLDNFKKVVFISYSSTASLLLTDPLPLSSIIKMGIYFILNVAVDANTGKTLLASTAVEKERIGSDLYQTILKLFLLNLELHETRRCLSVVAKCHWKRITNDFETDRFTTKRHSMSTDHRDGRDDFS